jgi:hypothetical protein
MTCPKSLYHKLSYGSAIFVYYGLKESIFDRDRDLFFQEEETNKIPISEMNVFKKNVFERIVYNESFLL